MHILEIYNVAAVFGHPSHGLSLSDMQQYLNSAAHFLTIEIEGAEFQNNELQDYTIFKFIHFNESH